MVSGSRRVPAARVGVLGLSALLLGGSASAAAGEPTQQELIDQVKALRSKVEQLEARQSQNEQPPAEAADGGGATLDAVLRDAERRSSPAVLQAEGFTAGYNKGKFLIQDAAGNFVLNPNFQFQARYVANFRESAEAYPANVNSEIGEGEEVFQDGLEIRRMKIAMDGNAFGPGLTYKFQWATSRSSGQLLLEDAWVRWAFGTSFGEAGRDWAVRIGQFKDPFAHEEIVSSKRQLAVDRTLVNEVLAGGITDYIQGVSFIWDDGADGLPLRAEIGYSDGPNTDNTNVTDTGGLPAAFPGLANPNYGAFARIEYLGFGNWKQYDDFTAMGNSEDLFVLGAGVSYAEVGPNDVLFHTVDVQWEVGRLGMYAAYVGLYTESGGAGIPGTDVNPTQGGNQLLSVGSGGTYDSGFLVQAGYMMTEKWEVFGRYDQLMLDEDRLHPAAEDSYPEITAGVNYYLRGHAAKLTVDGVWLPNGVPNNQDGIGLLDPDGDETQFAVRAQFQLLL